MNHVGYILPKGEAWVVVDDSFLEDDFSGDTYWCQFHGDKGRIIEVGTVTTVDLHSGGVSHIFISHSGYGSREIRVGDAIKFLPKWAEETKESKIAGLERQLAELREKE